jgi:hypothetical protein
MTDVHNPSVLFIRMEHVYKSRLQAAKGRDPELISAVDPITYSRRFFSFVHDHIPVRDRTELDTYVLVQTPCDTIDSSVSHTLS